MIVPAALLVIIMSGQAAESVKPASMARVGVVSERFQSYNVEMLEVTGGRFWRSYGSELDQLLKTPPAPQTGGRGTPTGMNPALYEYRPPIDLSNTRLRKLAAGLGPAYMRVSGTWANNSYFAESDQAPTEPPQGFSGVLTRQQWKGVIDFARAVDAKIVTSFATSVGTRDAAGVWTPAQARRFLDFTKASSGAIAAAEFMNEPTFASIGGAPTGYDAAAYGRDFKVFLAFARQAAPDMTILGHSSVGEAGLIVPGGRMRMTMLSTRDLLAASGRGVDAFSYHHYGTASKRCGGSAPDALSEEWLARTDATLAFYKGLRDEFEPGKPMWLTEVADAACGGNPAGSWFIDTFRYLDQAGRLAKQGVQVVAHNTLAASDYGLIDEKTLTPKPNYWGALLWHKLMGTTVLDSGVPVRAGLHVYAHCLRDKPGGVALLVINTDKAASQSLNIPLAADRFTLTAQNLEDSRVQLNGRELRLAPNDDLPPFVGVATKPGLVALAPASITFLAMPGARNAACRD